MRKVGTAEDAEIGASEQRQCGMGRATRRQHCQLDLLPRLLQASQMKKTGAQKKVTGIFLRGITFPPRTIGGILCQSPCLLDLAAHEVK
jgi:hypothetical protein